MRKWVPHVVACVVSIIVATFFPLVLYILVVAVGVATGQGGLGGPLNFVLIPLGGFMAGCLVTLALYLPAGLVLTAAVRRFRLKSYQPVLVLVALGLVFGGLFVFTAAPDFEQAPSSTALWFSLSGLSFGLSIQWFTVAAVGSLTRRLGGA